MRLIFAYQSHKVIGYAGERERDYNALDLLAGYPASLIAYRRRNKSKLQEVKTIQDKFENLHVIFCAKNDLIVDSSAV